MQAQPQAPPQVPAAPQILAPVGWESFLNGDETPVTPAIEAIADQVMYDSINQTATFYKPNFARLIEEVFRRQNIPLPRQGFIQLYRNEAGVPQGYPQHPIVAELRYYYNRQLIFQMCNIPRKTISEGHPFYNYPSIPIQRAPKKQLQCDIMYYVSPYDNTRLFILVIIDIFSRFVWSYNVEAPLTAEHTATAFERAFKQSGNFPNQYFNAIRNDIDNITFDSGGEFRGQFVPRIQQLGDFPNAKFYMAEPKHKTFGNPSNTGPVEAAIRMLRRTIRDQISAVGYLDRPLQRATQTYNQLRQTATLQNHSPEEVAREIMQNGNLVGQLQQHMNQVKDQKIQAKTQFMQQMQHPLQDPNIGYRIYLKQQAFVKEEDIRVSLQVFKILRQSPYYVDLIEERPAHRNAPQHRPQILTNVLWQSLVRVKLPVMDGPGQIGVRIRRNFAERRVQNGNVNYGTPHIIDFRLPYVPPPPLQPGHAPLIAGPVPAVANQGARGQGRPRRLRGGGV